METLEVRSRRPASFVSGALAVLTTLTTLGVLAAGCSDSKGGGGLAATASGAAPVTSSTTSPVRSSTTPGSGSTPMPVNPTTPITGPGASGAVLASGTLRALTYNVAGLPQFISGSSPATNTSQISPKLNTYDLVLAQEDFTYHIDLARDALHPFQSLPQQQSLALVNDGLNRLSQSPFVDFTRTRWSVFHGLFSAGADGWASKGFSAARHTIAPGVEIDVYNLHADAGSDQGDIDARITQFAQLSTFIQTVSAGRAVIVGGDTNLKGARRPRDEQTLLDFMGAANLKDAARTLGAPEDIDRFFFRSTTAVVLVPVRWREADEFVDANGNDLSDHEANNVDFEWRRMR